MLGARRSYLVLARGRTCCIRCDLRLVKVGPDESAQRPALSIGDVFDDRFCIPRAWVLAIPFPREHSPTDLRVSRSPCHGSARWLIVLADESFGDQAHVRDDAVLATDEQTDRRTGDPRHFRSPAQQDPAATAAERRSQRMSLRSCREIDRFRKVAGPGTRSLLLLLSLAVPEQQCGWVSRCRMRWPQIREGGSDGPPRKDSHLLLLLATSGCPATRGSRPALLLARA
jgi:hypothetical protein